MKKKQNGNYFLLPNNVFLFGLTPSEFIVYAFLRRSADKNTHQCWPSFSTIGKYVCLSKSTVHACVDRLREKRFITTEPTNRFTADGKKLNGTLLYTVLSPSDAEKYYHEQQKEKLETTLERASVQKKLQKRSD